jgi:putative ABC transport system permease protein
MLGSSVAAALFPNGSAVDRTLMMDGAEYTVIGVYAKAKGGFFGENGMDNAVEMPLRTAQSRYPQVDRYMITAKARAGHRQEAFDEVEGVIRRLRHLPTGGPTTSRSPHPTRSSSSSTGSPGSSDWWPSRFPLSACWWAASV